MTVIRRFDAGDIKGYRVPLSGFRRIPRESLIEFATRYGLPLSDLSRSKREAASTGAPGGNCRRALVVEDDRKMAALLEKVLTGWGWEVRVARNGFDAGLFAGAFLPDLIILDILLPGLDGREACRQMRADQRLGQARILAVTALRDDQSIQEIMDAGADGYLAKPFNLEEFRKEVASLFAGAPVGRFPGIPKVQPQGAEKE
jgi:CheY-like chemotaxis protein